MIATSGLAPLLVGGVPGRAWTLRSGPCVAQWRETQRGLDLVHLGPDDADDSRSAEPRGGLRLVIEGRAWTAADFAVTEALEYGEQRLTLTLRHRLLPLEVQWVHEARGNTGAFTQQLTLTNLGQHALHIAAAPSLALDVPGGTYQLTTLQGGWGLERTVHTEPLTAPREFVNNFGRSTAQMSAWAALAHEGGLTYLAQLAWSGNWFMTADPGSAERDGRLELGVRFDRGEPLVLLPGETFELPEVAYTATRGDLDDAANALKRYQRDYVIPHCPTNEPLLVQFNSWYPLQGPVPVEQLKRCVDVAAEIGCEAYVQDAGWFSLGNWWTNVGDWTVEPVLFPDGLRELSDHARTKGHKFGLWFEIESMGLGAIVAREHPEWCLKADGKPVGQDRWHLDYSQPAVRAWAKGVIQRLMDEAGLDWIKLDYNVDIGESFDAGDGTRPGDVLARHIRGYWQFLDEVRAAWPKLVVESCASGGLRFDLGMVGHTHTTWISDRTQPKPSIQLGYGATLEFLPRACNHWMVGDEENGHVDLSQPEGWWDFLFRAPMNGQWGISSRVFDWSPELIARAQANVALYKQIRGVLADADVYHLTPPPAHDDPTGWCAEQYVAPDGLRSVITAYRLGQSEPTVTLRLRGLEATARYEVTGDGVAPATRSGAELAEGLAVTLGEEWRAAVVLLDRRQ